MSIDEKQVQRVAEILERWNPLGERANSVEDLEGYRYEAIDIIASYSIMPGNNKVAAATKQVLSQAFDLNLKADEVQLAAEQISKILE